MLNFSADTEERITQVNNLFSFLADSCVGFALMPMCVSILLVNSGHYSLQAIAEPSIEALRGILSSLVSLEQERNIIPQNEQEKVRSELLMLIF